MNFGRVIQNTSLFVHKIKGRKAAEIITVELCSKKSFLGCANTRLTHSWEGVWLCTPRSCCPTLPASKGCTPGMALQSSELATQSALCKSSLEATQVGCHVGDWLKETESLRAGRPQRPETLKGSTITIYLISFSCLYSVGIYSFQ